MKRISAAAAITLAALALSTFAPLSAHGSGYLTEVTFEEPGPVSAEFGSTWVIELRVKAQTEQGERPLGPADGTVDVYIADVPGQFSSGLPIQDGGYVFVSQPDAKKLLAPGEHTVNAVFNASKGSQFESSTTKNNLLLTITPLTLTAIVSVENEPSISPNPLISAALEGQFVEDTGGVPAGTWSFNVTENAGASVFTVDVAQPSGANDPIIVEIAAKLKPGTKYAIASTFTLAGDLVDGVTVSPIESLTLSTPARTLSDIVGSPVALPLWLLAVLILITLALVVLTAVLGLRTLRRGRGAVQPAQDAADLTAPTPGESEAKEAE